MVILVKPLSNRYEPFPLRRVWKTGSLRGRSLEEVLENVFTGLSVHARTDSTETIIVILYSLLGVDRIPLQVLKWVPFGPPVCPLGRDCTTSTNFSWQLPCVPPSHKLLTYPQTYCHFFWSVLFIPLQSDRLPLVSTFRTSVEPWTPPTVMTTPSSSSPALRYPHCPILPPDPALSTSPVSYLQHITSTLELGRPVIKGLKTRNTTEIWKFLITSGFPKTQVHTIYL